MAGKGGAAAIIESALSGRLSQREMDALLWCVSNKRTIAKITGFAPCRPEEWEVIELSFLRLKKYDLLYTMIIHRLLQERGAALQADVCKSLKPLLCDSPPKDSLESLRWCLAHKELISPILDKRMGTGQGQEGIIRQLTVEKRYDLLFFIIVRDSIHAVMDGQKLPYHAPYGVDAIKAGHG